LENPDLNIPRCFAVIAIDYQRSKSGFWQKRCVGSGSVVQKQRRVSLFLRCFRLFFSPTQPFGKFLNALRLVQHNRP
jgi:hypothetical protein